MLGGCGRFFVLCELIVTNARCQGNQIMGQRSEEKIMVRGAGTVTGKDYHF